ncbi:MULTISPECIES: NADase-type glycan-binding domain-containing protein [unclassified Streptomyces]|uniref:NADase-type glycan-binding domain-containing protein n=1 Tax=unclassified Streptomyces TaxID=2593676 RepID=UPI002E35C6E2|nr:MULTISPECIES: zinc ribbon domain-containing protein [unclassified Streptomyces]
MTTQTPGTEPGRAPACAECGTRAEPGQSFCDACGAVLDWAGSPAVPAGARAVGSRAGEAAGSRSPGAVAVDGAPPAADARDERSTDADASGAGGSTAGSTAGEPGRDGFAVPAAGTATARTAHDPGAGVARRRTGTAGPDSTDTDGHTDGAGAADAESTGTGTSTSTSTSTSGTVGHSDAGPDVTAGPRGAANPVHGGPDATVEDVPRAHPTLPDAPSDAPTHDAAADTEPLPSAAPDVSRDVAAERARSLLVPVADPEERPAASSVAPVLPGLPVANRPQVRAPGAEPGTEGGTPCPWCATPNRPDRHFCGRCALPMAGERQTPGRLPWWRRVLNSRDGQPPWAGDRPRLRHGFGRVMNWVVGAVVLTLVVVAAMNTGTAVQAVKDHFAKRAPIGPDSYKASRSFPGHGPALAFDKLNNTWWGPGVSQSGDGEWLEARFAQPTRLLDLVITPGVSTRADQLSQSALPHRVEALVTTADGKTRSRFLTLDQGAGGQSRKFRAGDVTAVRFIIRSAYGAAASKQVSIAEIEFFGPSNSNGS